MYRTSLIVLLFMVFSTLVFANTAPSTEKPSHTINVSLELAPDLENHASKGWLVYVFAIEPGKRIPVASKTVRLNQLPVELVLTNKDFLLPEMTLDHVKRVVIKAKAKQHGDAHKTMKGDLEGKSEEILLPDINQFANNTEMHTIKTSVLINTVVGQ